MRKGDRIFVDGLSTVKMTDGVIVMEFFNNRKSAGADIEEPAGEVVMGQRGFLRAYQAMEDLINKMEQAGIVQRKSGNQANGAPSNPEPASPNFE
jgi:hypothetical protein